MQPYLKWLVQSAARHGSSEQRILLDAPAAASVGRSGESRKLTITKSERGLR